MEVKNTIILLIFLISLIGLLIGIYYTEDINTYNPPQDKWEKIYEDNDGVITITLEKKEEKEIDNIFT